MPERLLVVPDVVRPTRYQQLVIGRLNALDTFFNDGNYEGLDPLWFIRRNPKSPAYLFDGHHRLRKAYEYGVLMPALVYNQGEIHTDFEGKKTVIDKLCLTTAEICFDIAQREGFRSVRDFRNPTEEATDSGDLFREVIHRLAPLVRR